LFLSAIPQWLTLACGSAVVAVIIAIGFACLRVAALADQELEYLTAALPREHSKIDL